MCENLAREGANGMTLAIIELDARADGELRKRTVDVERIPEMAKEACPCGKATREVYPGGRKSEGKASAYSAKLDKCISMLGRAVERKAGRKYGDADKASDRREFQQSSEELLRLMKNAVLRYGHGGRSDSAVGQVGQMLSSFSREVFGS